MSIQSGDAMVIDPSIRLEELIHKFNHKDLIIAEDIHLGCPINAGDIDCLEPLDERAMLSRHLKWEPKVSRD